MSERQNCWEFKSCGRTGVEEPCPASEAAVLDGIHGGENGGRACWAVVGTLCGGTVQSTYATKIGSCLKCDFYHSVQKDERGSFVPVRELIAVYHS